ncbi:MAG: HIT domain-containing protein [Thermodesulfobacteriota bacterium]|nr:HIT domain-containing protein [Thermodesulfobacteriota bacterium]
MKNIWAPWRAEYILKDKKDSKCIFCEAARKNDPLIIDRKTLCFSIMNRFPYTSGHCMVLPYRHTGDITTLSAEENMEMTSMVQSVIEAIRQTMNPDGFNVGCNMGSASGAGIEDHIHIHIVPRWNGDVNFMPVLSDVHMISEHIDKTKDKIKKALS